MHKSIWGYLTLCISFAIFVLLLFTINKEIKFTLFLSSESSDSNEGIFCFFGYLMKNQFENFLNKIHNCQSFHYYV